MTAKMFWDEGKFGGLIQQEMSETDISVFLSRASKSGMKPAATPRPLKCRHVVNPAHDDANVQPRGVKTSRGCHLKCSESAAGQELASFSAAACQLPPLASVGVTFTGPRGRRFLKDAPQIESRFVFTASALRRPRGVSATLIRGRHRANRISVIRRSVRAPLLSLIPPPQKKQDSKHAIACE